ncbi:pyridoxal phosphate-dependent transferase [Bombardia bombarda]|uniref:Pyridoxal phosphate-dependent transferase n=1 Tax=Bombardia bombarda TaxID=252184 RepID=A0AA39T169_9PEZI|nr:pyridoxal phosphate-dependent transferase [Bombardia bombarda]
MATLDAPESICLGESLPPKDQHAVGVHLPKWADTVGWASREPRVVEAMTTGYPRFFIPRVVDQLAERLAKAAYMQLFAVTLNGGIAKICPYLINQRDAENLDSKERIFVVSYPAALSATAKAIPRETRFAADSARCQIAARFASGQSCPDLPVDPADVFLYPTGMAAISEAAAAIKACRPNNDHQPCVVAVFGCFPFLPSSNKSVTNIPSPRFLYVDTFKTLTRILNFHTTLHKYSESEIDTLESQLTLGTLALDALFTEFPGNPLLQSPNLGRLHALSRKHNFILVVDDTVGTYANLALLPACNVICTSLTKMFSGACNVMGGSVVVSPRSPHHGALSAALQQADNNNPNTWFPQDVITMAENSHDFLIRARQASTNTLSILAILRDHPTVKSVYYPLDSPTQHIYEQFRRKEGGYGFLLSIEFVRPAGAMAFYDNLDVAKGPSLGANFTLCCAYTLLAHYKELEWAAEFGVVEHLVRISVGLEGEEWLVERVGRALRGRGRLLFEDGDEDWDIVENKEWGVDERFIIATEFTHIKDKAKDFDAALSMLHPKGLGSPIPLFGCAGCEPFA